MTPATLRAIMSALLTPGTGCPWDLKQTHQSLARYLREEAGEVLDALAAHVPGDPEKERHLCEELGDLWLQVAFHAQLAAGPRRLGPARRGGHGGGEAGAAPPPRVRRGGGGRRRGCPGQLGRHQEGREGGPGRRFPAGCWRACPQSLSPLDAALEIGRRCAKVGFEWPDMEGVLDKVQGGGGGAPGRIRPGPGGVGVRRRAVQPDPVGPLQGRSTRTGRCAGRCAGSRPGSAGWRTSPPPTAAGSGRIWKAWRGPGRPRSAPEARP